MFPLELVIERRVEVEKEIHENDISIRKLSEKYPSLVIELIQLMVLENKLRLKR